MKSNAEKKRDFHFRLGDIAPVPEVENPKRRAKCKKSLASFLKTYMPHLFYRPFSKDQTHVIEQLEIAIRRTGKSAKALPRGCGKTTIGEGAALWALLYGFRRFFVVIGPSEDHAKAIMKDIKSELEANELLLADFPEVCYPIYKLEGRHARSRAQHVAGKLTNIQWKTESIAFPIVEGSAVSGSIIRATGITSSIRGMKSGELRPDFVLLDDPQTRESASSVKQTEERQRIIDGDIIGLAGHNKTISAYMTCTVICKDDLADKFLDTTTRPDWHGKRSKLVYKWPDNVMWDEYDRLWSADHATGDSEYKTATQYYKDHRKEMDAGIEIADPSLFDSLVELSGIQHARNLLLSVGQSAFEAEYQNSPKAREFSLYEIDSRLVQSRINNMSKHEIDKDARTVVAFADINYSAIHWALCAFRNDRTGFVVDYGKIPERGVLIEANANDTDVQRLVYEGIARYVEHLNMIRLPVPIRGAFIDRGFQPKVVHQFARYAQAKFLVMPAKGYGGGQYRVTSKVVGKPGIECHISESQYGQMFSANSDYFREVMQRGFLSQAGQPGSLSFFGKDPQRHEEIAGHITSEVLVDKAEGKSGLFWKWAKKPGSVNDWGDALTGCMAAATWFLGDVNPATRSTGGRGRMSKNRRKLPRRKPKVQMEE